MNISSITRSAVAITASILSTAALAQAAQPMSEVVGQPIQVTTNGVTNTVYFDANGTMRVMTPNGSTVPGNWALNQGNLCMSVGGAQECVPYDSAFQPQVPKTMTSSCNSVQTWLAQSTNNPSQQLKGERGQ